MTAQTNQFIASLTRARSDAIKREIPVTLCKSANGLTCAPDGNWADGWIVFADEDTRGTLDGNDEIIDIQVNERSFKVLTDQNFATWISYDRLGRSTGNGGAATGWLALIDARGPDHARVVIISRSGRVSVDKGYVSHNESNDDD